MRIIDADALKEDLKDPPLHLCLGGMSMRDVLQLVDYAPTIDAEPVVRCKDCEHWDVSENEYSICCHAYHNMMMVRSDGMGFCADGERKDNG